LALQVSIGSLAFGAEIPQPSDEVVMMKPYVVEKKSENGKIPLIIQAKDSEKTRLVELQFGEPAAQPKHGVPSTPAVESAQEEAGLAAGGALRSVEP
jgi:hypothetical protein